MSYIGANDLVFNNNKTDGVFGGGFSVQSIMLKGGFSPIMTINNGQIGGEGKVSDIFAGLAVPAYVTYNGGASRSSNSYKHNNANDSEDSEDDVIDDDLHDKLLGLIKVKENELNQSERKKKNTRKPNITRRGGTKKMKKSK